LRPGVQQHRGEDVLRRVVDVVESLVALRLTQYSVAMYALGDC
jgi:hypothetical protein